MFGRKFSWKAIIFLTSFLSLVSLPVTIHSQKSNVEYKLVDQFHKKSNMFRSDLVYIQTSKDIYETEENLWFKGYVLNQKNLKPSARNKILFVQLVNDITNLPVWEEKYEIENGFVNGHIYLDHSLKEGDYTMYAYSASTLGSILSEFHSARKIRILNSISSYTFPKKERKNSIQFNVFPEGGYFVSDIESYVAFKAIDSQGLPIEVSGTVYENDVSLLDFESSHAGMGRFKITPDATKRYHIEVFSPSGQKTYFIQDILSSGHTLQLLSNTDKELRIKVSKSNIKKENVYIRVQMNGTVYMIVNIRLTNEMIVRIPLSDIPRGIAEITLFNNDLKPLAERLIFVNQDRKLNISTILNKTRYTTREKAILKVKTTDQYGRPVVAHLGLSVFDKLYRNYQGSKTIESHYLLSSKLKGQLYNPTYYFDTINQNRKEALDLLLCTQGWRRYIWTESNLENLVSKKSRLFVDDIVRGRIVSKRRPKKLEFIPKTHAVMTFSGSNEKHKELVLTDSLGRFDITPRHLRMANRAYLYVKALDDPEREFKLSIGDYRFKNINKWRTKTTINYPIFENLLPKSKNTNTFKVMANVNQLNEVNVKGRIQKVFRDKYLGTLDSLAGVGINLDYVCGYNILNCQNHTEGRKPVIGETLKENSGSIIVYSRKSYTEAELLEKFNLAMIKGYYGKKEFYQPKYDPELKLNDPFPDTRNTLFWKSNLITNNKGEASIEFFCSDINTGFLGQIEGVDNFGMLGSNKFEFRVIAAE